MPRSLPCVEGAALLLGGESHARDRLRALLERVASTPRTTALVRGERGAGLGIAARVIHACSARRSGPCVEIRAGDSLRTAFAERVFGPGGPARAASGGTLVVLEVQDLDDAAQRALLGELADPTVDVRVVATSSASLEEEVALGRMRADLLYRLNVLAVDVPPLRGRAADVLAIARAALEQLAAEAGLRCPGFAADAAAALQAYAWPGNLPELCGVLAAALARTRTGVVRRVDLALPDPEPPPADPFAGERNLRALEERVIRLVLRETGGNKSRAARLLGLNRQTLYNKLVGLELADAR
jgi:DNA-binding NtrC family response regulator